MPSINPPAHQAVSEHPAPLDVTHPSVKEDQDRDVKRKLMIYEAVKACQAGYLPTNAQIDAVLRKAIDHRLVATDDLSPASRQIQEDTNDVLQAVRDIIAAKNSDELIQNFLHESKGPKLDPTSHTLKASVSQQQAKEDASMAAQHLRTVLSLYVQNAEFRKVVFDLGVVGRDVLATSAVKVVEEKLRPTEEQLRDIGREAPAEETLTTPVPESKPGESKSKAKEGIEQAEGVKQEAQGVAVEEAQQGVQAVREQKVAEEAGKKKEKAKEVAEEQKSPAERERTKRTVKDRLHDFRERLAGDDESEKLRAQKDRAVSFFDTQFPQERREQFLYRLKKVVIESQKREEYDEAVSALLDKLDEYGGHAKHLQDEGATGASEISADPAFQRSFANLKIILVRISGRPLDGIIAAVDQLYANARKDEVLLAFWHEVGVYVRKALLEPGFILEDQCASDGRALRERGNALFEEKYAGDKDKLFEEVADWLKGFSEEPLNKKLGEDIQRLAKDLLFDENGSLVYKTEIWDDFRQHVLPALINEIGFIPVPRIEYQDKQVDLVIEDLVLRGDTLCPNFVDIETSYHVHFSPTKPSAVGPGANRGRAIVQLSQIQADVRDVKIAFRKKTGFPKLSDSGVADCLIGGQGISATVVLETAPPGSSPLFVVKSVKAHVGTLKTAIRHSAHDVMYKLILPLATGLIKRNIAHSVESAIRTSLEYADTQLHAVREQVKEASSKPGASKVDAFASVLSKKKAEGEETKAKVEAKTEEAQGRIIMGQPAPTTTSAGAAGQPAEVSQPTDAAPQKQPQAVSEGWQSSAFDFL